MAEHAHLALHQAYPKTVNKDSNQFCPAPRQMNPLLSAFYLDKVTNADELANEMTRSTEK
uniref:Uncharacterized protein n=1 Tax=Shewanella decolorationis TaxID=256839 RepID=A0A5B8QX99_9GAMM